ncbi:MAG TPA: hypothetical protein VGL65_08340 [Gemmatimonadales bacterium]|jgi:hypothetical protein
MATAVQVDSRFDQIQLGVIVRSGLILALIQGACVVVVSFITRSLSGTVEHALTGIVVYIGAMITIFWPGTRVLPRTIDGIAAAAGIGLAATWFFVPIDAFILQPLGMYTNRWHAVGGGSIWWYIPVWWMAGTFITWQGSWILAHRSNRTGEPGVPGAIVLVTITTAIVGAIAAAVHFPLAEWNVPTFAVAIMPGLVLANAISALGTRRG